MYSDGNQVMGYNGIDWLPELLLETNFNNWDEYLEAMYKVFLNDFVDSKPVFRGITLGLKRYPLKDNKEATFWHLITQGDVESQRKPNPERCERIGWSRPIIDYNSLPVIKIWENVRRRNEKRILLWFENVEYLVVLAKRKDKKTGREYILPWTAYPVRKPHMKMKLQKEYESNT